MNIANRGILVRLIVRQWGATQSDSEVSASVAVSYEASTQAGTYVKKLAESYLFQDFTAVANEARSYHLSHTVPWLDGGWRILPTTKVWEYRERMSNLMQEARSIAEKIGERRDLIRTSAKSRLGKMFKEEDFPTAEALRDKFSVNIGMMPIPNVSDFRLDLDKEQLDVLRKNVEEELTERNSVILRDLWQRLYNAVQHMHERLKGDDRKRFRSNMLDNVREMANLLPDLNILGDAELDNMAQEIREKLCKTEVEQLRTQPEKRQDVVKAANDILSKMSAFVGKNVPKLTEQKTTTKKKKVA